MKLSLVVVTPGKMEGRSIPIHLEQFLIGRDPECQLRPASPLISKRHCAVLIRANQAYLRDFESTNGSFVNDERVQGERELHADDRLKIGPLEFRVLLEAASAVNDPTPIPSAAAPPSADEAAAAMLLSLGDDGTLPGGSGVDGQGIPLGSTVMEVLSPKSDEPTIEEGKSAGDKTKTSKVVASGNTSSAAKEILEKYMRRPRREKA